MSARPMRRCRPTSACSWPAAGLGAVARTAGSAPRLALDAVKLEAPIAQPPTFLAIGLNYADHVAESSMTKPEAPVVFNKQVTCVVGPGDGIEVPTVAPDWVDYEGELGVVIGTRCRNVSAADAPSVVAGYLIVNDVSVRDWQRASPTMTMGKSWDTHGPTGPWLVSADEVGDPHDLGIRTWVDGDLRQDASTKQMITDCWDLIAHLSTAFTLLPGTIIATGTPAGVGIAMDPPRLHETRLDRAYRDRQARGPREPRDRPALTPSPIFVAANMSSMFGQTKFGGMR